MSRAMAERTGLRANDTDLPLAAARAAIQLDNVLLGRGSNLSSVLQFTELLEGLVREGASPSQGTFTDYSTVVVVGSAMTGSEWCSSAVTVEELVNQAARMVGDIKQVEHPDNGSAVEQEEIRRLRDFFVALSRSALASRGPLHGEMPDHPYRD